MSYFSIFLVLITVSLLLYMASYRVAKSMKSESGRVYFVTYGIKVTYNSFVIGVLTVLGSNLEYIGDYDLILKGFIIVDVVYLSAITLLAILNYSSLINAR